MTEGAAVTDCGKVFQAQIMATVGASKAAQRDVKNSIKHQFPRWQEQAKNSKNVDKHNTSGCHNSDDDDNDDDDNDDDDDDAHHGKADWQLHQHIVLLIHTRSTIITARSCINSVSNC